MRISDWSSDVCSSDLFVPVREGRQAQFHRIELLAGDRPVTQAHLVLARGLDTPPCPAPQPHPAPEEVEERSFLAGATMAGAIRTRPIMGEARAPGRGVVWMRMDGEVILGTPASPFAKACLFADFGNGVGSATHAEAWRSEEHTSELQSLMRISYDVFRLKKKIKRTTI